MTNSRSRLCAAASALAVAIPIAAVAHAAPRQPIKDCGDVATLDDDGVFIGAVTAQGGACTNARAIAAGVARSAGCKSRRSCR